MASLKEIKERINSVKSTLKITSAMKLMSSAKYHKFSSMMVPLKDYRDELQSCLNELGTVGGDFLKREEKDSARCCVVAISSNSSLCGGFNTNRNCYAYTSRCLTKCSDNFRQYHIIACYILLKGVTLNALKIISL